MFLRRLFCLGGGSSASRSQSHSSHSDPPARQSKRRKSKQRKSKQRKSQRSNSLPKSKPNNSKSTARKSTARKSTPRKKDTIPTAVRNAVWTTYHGEAKTGVCYCCGKRIRRFNAGWHCSHVLADVKGGEETVENLRTCCAHCNLSMGDQNLYVYMQQHQMSGPGQAQAAKYLKRHPSQISDTRTNNWIADSKPVKRKGSSRKSRAL